MRILFSMILVLQFLYGKDIKRKVFQNRGLQNIPILNEAVTGQTDQSLSRTSRDDTTTVFVEDFEGDLSGWELSNGWEFTSGDYYSPSTSLRFDDDNFGAFESAISSAYLLPSVDPTFESLHFSFAVFCDLPDFNGTDPDSGYLDDYYSLAVADMDNIPWNSGTWNAYDGNSYYCGVEGGGYLNDWVQFLDTPEISIGSTGYTLTTMMKWGIESPAGASVEGSCTDGWDAANVRISNDGGQTWNLLVGDDAYDFNYGFGWIWNDGEYDCGGSLENLAAGWGGQADWHQVTFDLSPYSGDNVIIRYAFGSDPAYSTPDDNTLTGLQLDDIQVTDGSGVSVFLSNADDNDEMTPAGLLWEDILYEWGNPEGVDNDGDGELDYHIGADGWGILGPGDPQSWMGNVDMDLTSMQGHNIRFKITARADDNHDGGNGTGLHIDDIHVWKVAQNLLPIVQNVNGDQIFDGSILINWDPITSESYDNDEISFNDGTFEQPMYMASGQAVMGTHFPMPYGTESIVLNSVNVYGMSDGATPLYGPTTLYGFVMTPTGPASTPMYEQEITTEAGWNTFDVNWQFPGSFFIGIMASETIGVGIDADAVPSTNSWANLGGWDTWLNIANTYSIPDGEFGIRVNVTTTGGFQDPAYNVYRSMNGGSFNLMFNGAGIVENAYVDNLISFGNEYCYKITGVFDGVESDFSEVVCVNPEAQTIYEMSYDDGSSETSTNAGNSNYLAVKFTPNNYPVDIYRASFYTIGSDLGFGWVNVWDDDGEGGLPGTLLIENIPINFSPGDWTPVPLSSYGAVISDGSFYVGWWETPDTPPVGVDTDSPADNSYIDLGIGLGWEPFANYFSGSLMIRVEVDSASSAMALDDNLNNSIPFEFALKQNYPNPFNPSTTIEFDLASDALTELVVYDIHGRVVESIVNELLIAGRYRFGFEASNLSSGMYFYTITAKDKINSKVFMNTKKLVLIK